MAKAQEIIEKAKKEIGKTEYPPNSNNVSYNTWYYGHEVYDGLAGAKYPWCVTFIVWLFKETKLLTKTASSTYLFNWFKKNGAIHKTPEVGDIAFFYFSKKKKQGVEAEHVGLVTKVSSDRVVTVEGNTSMNGSQDNGGMVCEKIRKLDGTIRGFGRPKYDKDTTQKKSNEEIAQEVIAGKWGTGIDRRKRLNEAGYDYFTIQSLVNKMLKG